MVCLVVLVAVVQIKHQIAVQVVQAHLVKVLLAAVEGNTQAVAVVVLVVLVEMLSHMPQDLVELDQMLTLLGLQQL
jgi:hypothetical protein